jgi:hypothetical protein
MPVKADPGRKDLMPWRDKVIPPATGWGTHVFHNGTHAMENITPRHLRCDVGASCHSVYLDGDELYIIGEVTESQDGAAKGECRVRIKREYFDNLPGSGAGGGN